MCGVVAVYLSIGQVGQDSNALLNVVERRTVEERLVAFQEANPQVGLVVVGGGGDAGAAVGGGGGVVGVVTVSIVPISSPFRTPVVTG